uniref:Uncharacterized protein n=1 Tax=Glossina palpalis gambiensis TaxID=67801 RepID=A0A1B0C0U2_9MUSC
MTVCLLAFTTSTATTTTNSTTSTAPTNTINVVNSYTLIFTHTNANKNVRGQNEHVLSEYNSNHAVHHHIFVNFGNFDEIFVQNTSLGQQLLNGSWEVSLRLNEYRQLWLAFKTISGYKGNLQTENENFYKYLLVLMSKLCSTLFQRTYGLEEPTKPSKGKLVKFLIEHMET